MKRYAEAGGTYSDSLRPYVGRVGNEPLTDDITFRALLREAGRRDPVMRRIQDEFFEEVYFKPAMAWADEHRFRLPLSALVIYDSYIHSGRLLRVIRGSFTELPPSRGGDERAWTTAYVRARHRFLAHHSEADHAYFGGASGVLSHNCGDVKFQRWSRGDAIDKPIADGTAPSWEAVQSPYWKNRYEVSRTTGEFSRANMRRMRRGVAPVVTTTEPVNGNRANSIT